MANSLPEDVRRQLLRWLHGRSDEEADCDELSNVLLQISLAVMLIFMLAFFLFMGKVGNDLSKLDHLETELAQSEKIRIINAAEEIASRYRIRYGVSSFQSINVESGALEYDIAGLVANGKLSQDGHAPLQFKSGAATAALDYGDQEQLKKHWKEEMTAILGDLSTRYASQTEECINTQIDKLKNEVLEVQTLAAAEIQTYLVSHPAEVKSPVIRSLLEKILSDADPAERARRISALSQELRTYVTGELRQQCGAAMLTETLEKKP